MSSILAMQELPSVDGTNLEAVAMVSTISATNCDGRWSGLTWNRC